MADVKIVVESRVREIMEQSGTGVSRLAEGTLEKLNEQVRHLILDACGRAKANDRVGLKPADF